MHEHRHEPNRGKESAGHGTREGKGEITVGNRRETDRLNSRQTCPSTYDAQYRVPAGWVPVTLVYWHLPAGSFSAYVQESRKRKDQNVKKWEGKKKAARATAGGSEHGPSPVGGSCQRKPGWNKKHIQSYPHALTGLSPYSSWPRESDAELVSTATVGRHNSLVIFLPPFWFPDNPCNFFGHTLPR